MKILDGIIVSVKTAKTAVVKVEKRLTHPLYKKRIKKDKKYKVDTGRTTVAVGDIVKIIETRPLSKDKHFRILQKI